MPAPSPPSLKSSIEYFAMSVGIGRNPYWPPKLLARQTSAVNDWVKDWLQPDDERLFGLHGGISFVHRTAYSKSYRAVRSGIEINAMRKTALNGNQFGFSSGDSGVASGPRSSTSATGSSKASTFTVSAATAI